MMTQKELNKQLLSMIPNLQKKFDEICNELDGIETGSTIVVEDVFMPFFIDAVVFDKKDSLLQAQSFIEWLSDYYDDEYAGDVLVISIYESIHYSSKCEKLINSLGPKAKKQYDSLEW